MGEFNIFTTRKDTPKMTTTSQTLVILTVYALMLAISYALGATIHHHKESRKASTKERK